MNKPKNRRIGQIVKNKDKKGNEFQSIKLGQTKNKDPKFNFTVQVRILDSEGNKVWSGENPYINLYEPHENAPDFVVHDLSVKLPEET